MKFLSYIIILLIVVTGYGCKQTSSSKQNEQKNELSDTLRAVTLYGPTSYFTYRGEEKGFDYENLLEFAKDNNLILDLKIASSMTNMIEMIESGEADLAAYPVPYIDEYKKRLLHTGPREISYQVIVQKEGVNKIDDVSELIGKSVYVEKDSKYHYRLLNLNKELGMGIKIMVLDRDSILTLDLIDMVNSGMIPFTVIDSDIASINGAYYPSLDMNLRISLDQAASWAVNKDNKKLKDLIDHWESDVNENEIQRDIYRKYFEFGHEKLPELISEEIEEIAQQTDEDNSSGSYSNKPSTQKSSSYNLPTSFNNGGYNYLNGMGYSRSANGNQTQSSNKFSGSGLSNQPGRISEYDELFRKYGRIEGIDWRLLAAISYVESRFSPDITSRFGAKGLMQIMDIAAKGVGEAAGNIYDPETNIRAGAKVFTKLRNSLSSEIADPEERLKFILASYNSGLGHIQDAMALARKYGYNPKVWFGNVSETAMMKSRPEFYNDPIVKHGYFRAIETVTYVTKVLEAYDQFKMKAPL